MIFEIFNTDSSPSSTSIKSFCINIKNKEYGMCQGDNDPHLVWNDHIINFIDKHFSGFTFIRKARLVGCWCFTPTFVQNTAVRFNGSQGSRSTRSRHSQNAMFSFLWIKSVITTQHTNYMFVKRSSRLVHDEVSVPVPSREPLAFVSLVFLF